MTLLSPWFLLGALAVGLPLWLHLLQRENPIRLPFSSLMLFEKRRDSSFLERRFRYLLLLGLRLAIIGLVAFAFAKPIWNRPPAVAAGEAPRLHLIVLDRSLSMQYGDRFERARDVARQVIDDIASGDQGQILTIGPTVDVVTNPVRDRAELISALEAIEPGLSRNSYGDVIEAARSLAPEEGVLLEVHLISDLQASAMPAQFSDLVLPAGAELKLHDIGGDEASNWAIESVKGVVRTQGDERPRLEVTVASFAEQPASRTVTLKVNGATVASESRQIPAMGRASFRFEGFEPPPGFARGEIELSPSDELPQDDRRLLVFDNSEPEPILFVTGDRRARDLLYYQAALAASSGAAFQLERASPGEAAQRDPSRYALVLLSDVAQPSSSFEADLRAYIEAGGAAFIAVGPETASRGVVPLTGQRVSASPLGRGDLEFQGAGRVVSAHPALEQLEGLRGVKFFRYARLQTGPDDDVLAALADGSPLLVERRIGQGRVLVFASSLDNVWNDLPVLPVFVPFAVETARYLAGPDEGLRQALVDDTFELHRRRGGGDMVQVFDPTGERTMTLSEAVTRRDLKLDQVGFYEIRASGGNELVAVNPDPRESNLRRIEPETLDLWSQTGAAEAARDGSEAALAATPPLRLWRWLLLLLIAIALLESLVGNSHLNVRREA